jgi:hypothetical protein
VRRRLLATIGTAAVVIAVALLALVPTAGQTPNAAANNWKPSTTPWGDPDLQGMWDTRTFTPMERPAVFGSREFMTEEEAASRDRQGLARVQSGDEDEQGNDLIEQDAKRYASADRPDQGQPGYRIAGAEYNAFWSADPTQPKVSLRTSQVIDPPDGKVPPLTRSALEKWEQNDKVRRGRSQADNWEDRGLSERCIVRNGLPGEMRGDTQQPLKQIVQSPGYVAIVMPYGYVRIIPLDAGPHVGPAIRQWNGDARGRWDGNSLVIETTNFKDTIKNYVPGHGGPFGGSDHVHYYLGTGQTLKLTERFTPTDAGTLEYRYTVEDPNVFVRPFTTVVYWNRDSWSEQGKQDRLFEYACHEHNYGIVNAIRGARVDRKAAVDEATREAAVRVKERQEKWDELKKWEATSKSTQ